jgi:SH3 domain-containing YSC84-like protein 1
MRHRNTFGTEVCDWDWWGFWQGGDHLPPTQLESNVSAFEREQAWGDFVLLIMNPKGANSILGSKVKLGADASAAAGPKGRAAAADTDIVMRAEVLSYSRSRGLFAGISLEGSTLRSDGSANRKLYGRELSAKEIVREGKAGVPASGRELIALLDKESPKNQSDPKSLKE